MIRFLDKEVYTIFKGGGVKWKDLWGLFLKKELLTTDIILVLDDEGEFYGIITYRMLVKYGEIEECIQKEFVYLDDNIWDGAARIFEENEDILYLPVLNRENQIEYFCWQEDPFLMRKPREILDEIGNREDTLFIQDIYPQVKALYIYGFNEIAYLLFKAALKKRFAVRIVGEREKWYSQTKAKEYFSSKDNQIEYADYERYNFYAEGTEPVRDISASEYFEKPYKSLDKELALIWELGMINIFKDELELAKDLSEEGVHVGVFKVPDYGDLKWHSDEEIIRHNMQQIEYEEVTEPRDEFVKKQFYEVYGKENCERVWSRRDNGLKRSYKYYISGTLWEAWVPEIRINCIYMIGPCIVSGTGMGHENSLVYLLQSLLDRHYPMRYTVLYKGMMAGNYGSYDNKVDVIKNLSFSDKDFIIFVERYSMSMDKIKKYNIEELKALFDSRPKGENWWLDNPIHTNRKGNMAVAEYIFKNFLNERIKSINWQSASKYPHIGKGISEEQKLQMSQYLQQLKRKREKNAKQMQEEAIIGSIVMNCNPFTLGHRYLIEEAAKKVDFLYVFVVKEDKSYFSYKDRIEMVRQGTKDIENLDILGSGEFVLSFYTFPDYFQKEVKTDMKIDASRDIAIFCEAIAPALNIKIRFAGEEPIDMVTKQYNDTMKELLPNYGIQFEEIPRKESEGQAISASMVRKLLKDGEYDKIRKLVPESTYQYLQQEWIEIK